MGNFHRRLLKTPCISWVMKIMVLFSIRCRPELILHLPADERIEDGKRLVEEPQRRAHRQRAGKTDALLLTARTLAGAGLLAPFESSPRSKPRSTRRLRALGGPLCLPSRSWTWTCGGPPLVSGRDAATAARAPFRSRSVWSS